MKENYRERNMKEWKSEGRTYKTLKRHTKLRQSSYDFTFHLNAYIKVFNEELEINDQGRRIITRNIS